MTANNKLLRHIRFWLGIDVLMLLALSGYRSCSFEKFRVIWSMQGYKCLRIRDCSIGKFLLKLTCEFALIAITLLVL